MLRRGLGQLLRKPITLSLLLFVPAAACMVWTIGTFQLGPEFSGVPRVSPADHDKVQALPLPGSPTAESGAAVSLPALASEAHILFATPLGPESVSDMTATPNRNAASSLPAATTTLAPPTPAGVTSGGQSNDPQPPPPPPPANTQPPPANTAPPPPQVEPTPNAPVQVEVVICHRPGGDPTKGETKTVSADAVADHLAHGDTLGACP
jgi:hypothetical protein